jgi:phosphocarrier protein FPr
VISIVVVSHSRALAEAAVALAGEMVSGDERPRVAVAAGLDATAFGTDAAAVAEAITEVDTPDGVLVLLDLGSAVLSAEMALEFLDPDVAGRVRLSSAPLVEGLVAAVVAASTGSAIDAVAAEAEAGLLGKREHLGVVDGAGAFADDAPEVLEDAESVEIEVLAAHGLHARPAARLVALVGRFTAARVTLTNATTGRGPVNAASLSQVATLDARRGHRLAVSASGPAASDLLEAVVELAADGFGDDAPPRAGEATAPGGASAPDGAPAVERGSGSGLDIAIGPALVAAGEVDASGYVAGSPSEESERSGESLRQAADRLDELQRHTASTAGPGEAEIFSAQQALLTDPEITTAVSAAIDAGASAVDAWGDRLDAVAEQYRTLSDPYLRERAADVRSVRGLVLRTLLGQPEPLLAGEGILVVPELDAATAATLDAGAVHGVVTVRGGSTGHGALVARSRGIPLLTDAGDVAEAVEPGLTIAFDASIGRLLVDPDEEEQERLRREIERRREARDVAMAQAQATAVTSDGHQVAVLANVASQDEAVAARGYGAEGSGLVRTEILFGAWTAPPTVTEQVERLLAVSAALDGRPMTARTWDVGGDKPLPFLPLPAEANPFLGVRGIRVFRTRPQLLLDQLQAVCLVAQRVPTKVMFPMVTTRDEVEWAREMLREAAAASTGDVPPELAVGIMIEVPAAALRAATLVAGLDFVSIGTNDLTQYTTAAERGNAAVAGLADPFDPAVLALVATVVSDVGPDVAVAVCGDLASSPLAVPLLVGLGVDELSCTPPKVPEVKAAVRDTDLDAARSMSAEALTVSGQDGVRALLADHAQRSR